MEDNMILPPIHGMDDSTYKQKKGSEPALPPVSNTDIGAMPQKSNRNVAGKSKQRELNDLKLHISEQFDVPAFMIDVESGADFSDRVDYSFSDTDKEIEAKFLKRYPNGRMARVKLPPEKVKRKGKDIYIDRGTRLVFRKDMNDPNSLITTVEDFGVTPSDLADMAGQLPVIAGSLAAAILTGGASFWVQLLAISAGAAGGHLAKEAVEEARGTQLQPWLPSTDTLLTDETSVLGDTARLTGETAIGAGITLAGFKVADVLRGAGALKPHPAITELEKRYQKGIAAMKKKGIAPPPDPTAAQMRPEDMIIQRLNAQGVSTSKVAQEHLLNQAKAPAQIAEQAAAARTSAYKAGLSLKGKAKTVYNAEKQSILNKLGRQTPRQSQQALKTAVADKRSGALAASKERVTERYAALERNAAVEKPIYDLTKARQGTEIIRSRLEIPAQGEMVDDVTRTVASRLTKIMDDIDNLAYSGKAVSYQQLKLLRSETGDLIENWPWQANISNKHARNIYRLLSKTMENPVNSAPKTVASHRLASATAEARYDMLDMDMVKESLSKEITGKTVMKYASPNTLSSEFITLANNKNAYLKDVFSKGKMKVFKTGVRQQMLLNGKKTAVQSLDDYRTLDPEGWKFFVPDKGTQNAMYKAARAMDELNASPLGKAIAAKPRQVAGILLRSKAMSRADVQKYLETLDDVGRADLRTSVYDDILTNASKEHKSGFLVLDKKKMGQIIKEYKENGIWESPILTADDRLILDGLESYLQITQGFGGDPGVSLEAAQAITQLKSPFTFIAGIHKLAVNSVAARFFMSKMGQRVLLGTGVKQFGTEPAVRSYVIAKGLLESTELGDMNTTEKMRLLMQQRKKDEPLQIDQRKTEE
jgi:hypothetical protein